MHHPYLQKIREWRPFEFCGLVSEVSPSLIKASGPVSAIGDFCEIRVSDGDPVLAEVVSVRSDGIGLTPLQPIGSIKPGARVYQNFNHRGVPVGDEFAGRAVNALGNPIDGKSPIYARNRHPRYGMPAAMLDRYSKDEQLVTGIKIIDSLFPLAVGQRIGIFSPSGGGKTSLMNQLSQQIQSDHSVICLVGERGCEVERFWRTCRAIDSSQRTTLVTSTSDESAGLRVLAVEQALAIAEYWCRKGKNVVLFVDSITRLALALREIGLAAGEPPTVRGYTPNIFAAMPRIVERCGADRKSGSITAIFTVLSETDEQDDPIVEMMKSLFDGHIMLSRGQAERGIFPAIDVSASISRAAHLLQDDGSRNRAARMHRIHADYEEARPLIESGLYQKGTSPDIDEAIFLYPKLMAFVQQSMSENWPLPKTIAAADQLLNESVPA